MELNLPPPLILIVTLTALLHKLAKLAIISAAKAQNVIVAIIFARGQIKIYIREISFLR